MTMPDPAAPSQAPRPAGRIAVGCRQNRTVHRPIARPAKNGHAVCQMPAGLAPSWCACLPMITKTRTEQASRMIAIRIVRRIQVRYTTWSRLAVMPTLLIIHHTLSPALQAMFEAVADGARTDEVEGVDVLVRPALTAAEADVLTADGYLLGTPANIGYM